MRPTPSLKHEPDVDSMSGRRRTWSGESSSVGLDDENACAIRAMYLAGMSAVSVPAKSPMLRWIDVGVTRCPSCVCGETKKHDPFLRPDDDHARNRQVRPPSSNPLRNRGLKRDSRRFSLRSVRRALSSLRTETDRKRSGRLEPRTTVLVSARNGPSRMSRVGVTVTWRTTFVSSALARSWPSEAESAAASSRCARRSSRERWEGCSGTTRRSARGGRRAERSSSLSSSLDPLEALESLESRTRTTGSVLRRLTCGRSGGARRTASDRRRRARADAKAGSSFSLPAGPAAPPDENDDGARALRRSAKRARMRSVAGAPLTTTYESTWSRRPTALMASTSPLRTSVSSWNATRKSRTSSQLCRTVSAVSSNRLVEASEMAELTTRGAPTLATSTRRARSSTAVRSSRRSEMLAKSATPACSASSEAAWRGHGGRS